MAKYLIYILLLSSFFAYGQQITLEDFELKNVADDKVITFKENRNEKGLVIIFWSNKCPYSEYYESRVKSLANKFKNDNINFFLVNSNFSNSFNSESVAEMKKLYQEAGFNFPYLVDSNQSLKNHFKVKKNPHAFFLVPADSEYNVIYDGAIDDNPQVEDDVGNAYLENSILNYLRGRKISRTSVKPIGCVIK